MVWQETVNLPACATVGSIPTTSTIFRVQWRYSWRMMLRQINPVRRRPQQVY
jgi:hypothetical protein